MGLAAPYRSLSQTFRGLSLDPEEDEHGDDDSSPSTGMDCSSDHHSLSSDQGFSECFKPSTPHNVRRQTLRDQGDPWDSKSRTLNCSPRSPHLNPVSLAHQECLSNRRTYSIKGLGVAQPCPQAMFSPIIRVYPPPYGHPDKRAFSLDYLRAAPFIEHIDITTVWKGLLLSDAERLHYLNETFQDCLEDLLADSLDNVHKEFQRQCASHRDQDSWPLGTSSLIRQLSFNLRHLVLFMSQRLKLCGKPLERGSTRDFELLLPLFLVSCDCLMGFEGDSVGDTAVDICVRYCDPSNSIFPMGPVNEAAWIPDMLSFNEIKQFQREGQELVIIPRYCGNAAFAANITRTDVQYSIESPEPWLTWDKSISGFRGNVPLFSETECVGGHGKVYRSPQDDPYGTVNILRVEIRALLTAGSGSPIRLQKTIRVRLTFKIVPWFLHDRPCAPTDNVGMPFCLHYPECDSPAPSSTSSRPMEKNVHKNPRHKVACDDVNRSVSSQSSRATSGLKALSYTERHQEDENKRHVMGTFNSHIDGFSIANTREDVDACQSRSATPGASSSCSIPTLHSRDNLSPIAVESHFVSGDVDKAPEVNDTKMVSVGTTPFDESLLASAASNKSLDPIYTTPMAPEKSNDEAISAQRRMFLGGQYVDPRIVPLDGDLISETSQRERIQTAELRNPMMRTCSDHWSGISYKAQRSHDRACASISGSRQSSSTMEIIVENSDVGPQIRREQAILWNVLSIKEAQNNDKGETMSVDELKVMCTAMKLSLREEEDREMARMGFSESFDDIFISSGSDDDIVMDE